MTNEKSRQYVSFNYQGRGMTEPFRMAIVMDPPTDLENVPYPEFVTREVERCMILLAEAGTRLVASTLLDTNGNPRPQELAVNQGLMRPDAEVIDEAMRTAYAEMLAAADRGRGALWATDVLPILERVHRALVHGHSLETRRLAVTLGTPELDPEGIALVEGIIRRTQAKAEGAEQ